MRCPDLKEIGGSTTPCNNLLQGPGTSPFVLIEILHENEIGKWREGSCDYASAAAVCVTMHACCVLATFVALLLLLAACANAELSCLA